MIAFMSYSQWIGYDWNNPDYRNDDCRISGSVMILEKLSFVEINSMYRNVVNGRQIERQTDG